MSIMMQGPAAPRAPATAEEAQLDQRIELAAKKAALRSLESQEGGPATGVPAPPGMGARVIIEQDGKTTVLENPTPQQLAQVGIGSAVPDAPRYQPDVSGWQLVAVIGAVVFGIVAVLYLFLAPRRRFLWGAPTAEASGELADRMARIENAIESVAVEVERISEGQRFTSRILSDGAALPVAMPARGEAEPRHNGEA